MTITNKKNILYFYPLSIYRDVPAQAGQRKRAEATITPSDRQIAWSITDDLSGGTTISEGAANTIGIVDPSSNLTGGFFTIQAADSIASASTDNALSLVVDVKFTMEGLTEVELSVLMAMSTILCILLAV